jgi:hypothetical protein
MKRLAFNGGEISPRLALRSDLDVYARSALCIENFDVSQMGGISRRKGMRPFADADPDKSKLLSYIYSNDQSYLVEVAGEHVFVYDQDANQVADLPCNFDNPMAMRGKQLNALLLLTSPSNPVHQLKFDGEEWTLKEYEFEHRPWRDEGIRDHPITVKYSGNKYTVTFDDDEDEIEKDCEAGEVIRASFYTNSKDCFANASTMLNGVTQITGISSSSSFTAGQKIAIRSESTIRYYSCTAEWDGSEHFVSGMISPENYPDNFIAAESVGAFSSATLINSLSSSQSYAKGDKIGMQSGYWKFYTCIKSFSSDDYETGISDPEKYPGHFIQGLAIGDPAPCRGDWEFYCSGTWIGEYEVRKCYETSSLTGEWESCGTSFSRLGATSNTLLTGNEQEEECYLRLFINRCRYDSTIANGYPLDSCSNRLIVSSYKHDLELMYSEVVDDDENVVSTDWTEINVVKVPFYGALTINNWSWQAFSYKYGFPGLCDVFNQRLVFAATDSQPQTVWLSATDDINNFFCGKTDDSAMALTMSTTTQNRICWMMAQGSRILLGTADAEWVISAPNSSAITYANARIDNHGFIGSANVPAVMASDKVVYVERGSGRLYQFGYDYSSDSYVSRDLTVFADHILADGGGVVDGCFVRKPDPKAVFVLADGTVALMTYNSMHEVNCWHRYTTDGTIESCTMLPNGTSEDSLFFIVTRDDTRYIEVIDGLSTYQDRYEIDYTSTMVTNAFTAPDMQAKKLVGSEIKAYFGDETQVDGLLVTTDGEQWDALDRNEETIPAGWNSLLTYGAWDYELVLGIRVSGDRALEVLAVQI